MVTGHGRAASSVDLQELRATFGDEVDSYDLLRPDYPASLLELCAPGTERRSMLEIGCGTGLATRLFLPRARTFVAVDSSRAMIEKARANLSDPRLSFVCGDFEAVELCQGTYDLVVAAQSFHWLDRTRAFDRARELLNPGGGLALFWNFVDLEGEPSLRAARDLIREAAPIFDFFPDSSRASFDAFRAEWERDTRSAFGNAASTVLDRERIGDGAWLLRWLTTLSWWKQLGDEVTAPLLRRLERELLATVGVPMRTLLVQAHRG